MNSARRRHAFTMLELTAALIVLAIVGLVALGLSQRVGNRISGVDAEAALARVLAAEQSYAASRGTYTADPSQLFGVGRDITVTTGASTTPGTVSIAVLPDGALAIASVGSDNECAGIWASNPMVGSDVKNHTWTGVCAASSVPQT